MTSPKAPARPLVRRPLFWVVLIAALLLIALTVSRFNHTPDDKTGQPAAPTTAVSTQQAIEADFPVEVTALGTVKSLKGIEVRPRVEGELLSVDVREGQQVKKGDVIARIDPRSYQAQLDQARGQLAQDQAQLSTARDDLARYQKLIKTNSISRQDLETQQQLVRQYTGTVASDKASVEDAKVQLDYTTLTAPIDGRIGIRNVDPGNIVQLGDEDPLMTLTDLSAMSVVFSLPSRYRNDILPRFDAGQPLKVTVLDDADAPLATGSVTGVDSMINTATGTLRLRARVDNDEASLYPNQFVNVQLVLHTLKGAVVLPRSAIQTSDDKNFVYHVEGDKVSRRPVTLAADSDTRVAVAEGVSAGDDIVVDGVDRLSDGARVKVVSHALPGDPASEAKGSPTDPADAEPDA
ncbi:efflux RND transporter periplasmic adaptor subunit [Larsenimonas rhizosphaerae]|uniref:efflux RND transporter periplasmic adaptor subunit n=1 Tax=Larsenimonas rhizosphaerae TaxID=2944682 RepID=UPI00203431A6|nr:efflux RND transporter periplasmic adaptor subunit [Larsenimonas rhizosphaerae]MCM2131134.1 efflux RND transporter periplasmic adaptor subunit [Larsenimonas rhizosphaerae]